MTTPAVPAAPDVAPEAAPERLAPMRRQYLEIKARFPDTILLFRLGDFYETFDGDAELAAGVLDIVLTSREAGKGQRMPMAGIPYHAAEGYIGRLIAAGHKVAICEQVGEVTKGKGLVERDVTRVVTPGTVVEPSMLDARQNNYIAGLVLDGRTVGLAAADITTGEFTTSELAAASAEEALLAAGRELLRLNPAEIVLPAGSLDAMAVPAAAWLPEGVARSKSDAWRWRLDRTEGALKRHFKVEALDGFGCAGKPLAIRAAGGLLDYLQETQLSGLAQITSLATSVPDRYMTLDAQTRRNLELTESTRGERRHSLLHVLDTTRTPMGARLLRRWVGQPLLDLDELRLRQDGVEALHGSTLRRAELRKLLGEVGDIERLANRVLTGAAQPRELAQLRLSLTLIPGIREKASGLPGWADIADCEAIHRTLADAIADDPPSLIGKGGAIRPGFSAELDGHAGRAREAREWIANLERVERERTGVKSLKVGYNKVFGYYIEISAAALATAERERGAVLPHDYLPKQSLANATRYYTPQLKEYETVVLTAQDTLAQIESDVYRQLLGRVGAAVPTLLEASRAIAYLDVIAALAETAVHRRYVRPELDHGGRIEVSDGRHPTIEALLPRGAYVANDIALGGDDQIVVLTGPNMAGKSSWLRQVALTVLLAQIGSFVPASSARVGLVDRIFTRIGAQDDIATGQSTFMVEMLETANILNHATSRSLVVLDEIGRGTSTYDGLAIARAIVEHLHDSPRLGATTVFATHYHELTELGETLERVRCYRMDVLEEGDQVVFLRRVVPGGADRSYGIHVAELAGIPRTVVQRARRLLADLEEKRPSSEAGKGGQVQLTLFNPPHPVVEQLRLLDVDRLSPLEALNTLSDLKRRVDAVP